MRLKAFVASQMMDRQMENDQPWLQDWEIIRPLGEGGQGHTFLVHRKSDHAAMGVLKTLKQNELVKARARMRREVVSLDTLSKEKIKVPGVLESNTESYQDINVQLFFIMEFVPGRTLADEVKARGPQSLDKSVAIVRDLALTLAAAHKQDVHHRDLKPDNIMVKDFDSNDLVIVDYGLSFNKSKDGEFDLTEAGEQIRNSFLSLPETNTPGGDRRDHRSDITYAAAILCYCLTGRKPGQLKDGSGNPPHRYKGHSVREAISDDARLRQIESFLDRGLSYELESRFQSWDDFQSRLTEATRGTTAIPSPAESAAQLNAYLTTEDRATRHKMFEEFAEKLMTKIDPHVKETDRKVRPVTVKTTRVTFGKGEIPPRLGVTTAGVGRAVTIGLALHKISVTVEFVIAHDETQCVLLRRQKQSRGDDQTPAGEWQKLQWFTPDMDVDSDTIRLCVDDSISLAIQAIHKTIAGKGG